MTRPVPVKTNKTAAFHVNGPVDCFPRYAWYCSLFRGLTSSGGIDDEFELSEDKGAADDEERISSGGSDEGVDEEGVIGVSGEVDLFCCVKDDGVLFGPVAFTVFCDAVVDFIAFVRTGERCNCRICILGSTGLERTREKTTRSTVFFKEKVITNSRGRQGCHDGVNLVLDNV